MRYVLSFLSVVDVPAVVTLQVSLCPPLLLIVKLRESLIRRRMIPRCVLSPWYPLIMIRHFRSRRVLSLSQPFLPSSLKDAPPEYNTTSHHDNSHFHYSLSH
ncbi:hypothetical protein JAAARDRAFT_322476 [Jaapia argillacea MUCL 33604]|uniref:Uncharacterized protein n=1 Tax=Jaapia argillacea MUCL 33604 TaxID=933084 RepID=A0A067PN18_9AGAM|nr:hypothetical protein JAAARDRAFT_322476 [Jaapia argillacea MUCL 33604]